MAQSAMTVRLDSQMKSQFDSLCEQFGMSANTAINIFVNAVVHTRSIPFPIQSAKEQPARERAHRVVEFLRQEAAETGVAEMPLEEINAEIRKARKECKERK